jgi:hypothetical protein
MPHPRLVQGTTLFAQAGSTQTQTTKQDSNGSVCTDSNVTQATALHSSTHTLGPQAPPAGTTRSLDLGSATLTVPRYSHTRKLPAYKPRPPAGSAQRQRATTTISNVYKQRVPTQQQRESPLHNTSGRHGARFLNRKALCLHQLGPAHWAIPLAVLSSHHLTVPHNSLLRKRPALTPRSALVSRHGHTFQPPHHSRRSCCHQH